MKWLTVARLLRVAAGAPTVLEAAGIRVPPAVALALQVVVPLLADVLDPEQPDVPEALKPFVSKS